MSSKDRIVLVTGATGQQGGATARHLLARGWRVRALTRDPNKSAAQALAQAGAEVAVGDHEDRASLDRALEGVYGVFSVQNFWLPNVGAEGEVRQGKLIADAVKAANIQHLVYTSVGGAERSTGIPHFETKWQIEEYTRALGLPATVLRPVFFMDNFNWTRAQILNGTFLGIRLRPEKPLQLIAAEDIGAIAAIVFENPTAYIGKALEIAGDELTESQIAETFSRVIGRPVQVGQMPLDPNREVDQEGVAMLRWFNEKGYQADIPAVRAVYPQLQTLETWLRGNGWENAEPVPEATGGRWG